MAVILATDSELGRRSFDTDLTGPPAARGSGPELFNIPLDLISTSALR